LLTESLEEVEQWKDERTALEVGRVATERARKTLLLFQHYGIDPLDPKSWESLAVKLAIDLVPGFEVYRPQKRGAKNKWDHRAILNLWWAVYNRRKGMSVRSACFNLAERQPWINLLPKARLEVRQKRLYAIYENEAMHSPVVTLLKNALEADWPDDKSKREWAESYISTFQDLPSLHQAS
jgi:hypothetical protein